MVIIIKNRKKLFTYLLFFVGCFFILFEMFSSSNSDIMPVMKESDSPSIAIIIDDFGNNSKGTKEMLSLPIKFTGAVMPEMPNTKSECGMLIEAKKDVILHMPMEPHKGKKSWLGKAAILNDYSKDKALSIFTQSLSQIENCIGFNNHMGSKVTENKEIITELLKEAKQRNLIVIDSVTGPKSVVGEIAEELGVRYVKRDVFLDSTTDTTKIIENLKKAGKIAKEKGLAVAIGHVGAEGGLPTYNAILRTYKDLESEGIKFIGVSDIFK